MRAEFTVHRLNPDGMRKAVAIAESFSALLDELERDIPSSATNARDMALVRTKLQEACFFAKRAMALHPAHHEGNPVE